MPKLRAALVLLVFLCAYGAIAQSPAPDSLPPELQRFARPAAAAATQAPSSMLRLRAGTDAATQVDNGTAAAPGLIFASSTSTGLFSPSANVFALSTAGAERFRVDAAGNVGIGVTAPGGRLDVGGSGTVLSLNGSTNGGSAYGSLIFMHMNNATAIGELAGVFVSGFRDNTAAGTVTSNYGIHIQPVNDSIYGTIATSNAAIQIDDVNNVNAANNFAIRYGYASSPFVVTGAGNVGIGTTSPNTKLAIQSPAYTSATDGIKFVSSDNSIHNIIQPIKIAAGAMNLWVGANTYVDTTGNIARFDAATGSSYLNVRSSDGAIRFGTGISTANPAEKMIIDSSGNVGIGYSLPGYKLDVNGTIHATSITANSVIGAVYQDMAEWVPATEKMTAGTVVVLNRDHSNEVMPSAHAYDTAVAGVVSAQPGIILGVGSDSKAQIATTGRVKVHVDATMSAVSIGDLLVTSDRSGTAMKSQPVDLGGIAIHRPGTVIGKALEPLQSGEGDILVLLSLQ
jgi:hypothetical protein